MLNVSLTFDLGTCWAAWTKACLRMGRRSSLSSPKFSLCSINTSSIYRSCRGRNRAPYSFRESPPCPQPEHPSPCQTFPPSVAKYSLLNLMALSLLTTLPGNTQRVYDPVLIKPWKSCLEIPVAFHSKNVCISTAIIWFRILTSTFRRAELFPFPVMFIAGVASRFSWFNESCVIQFLCLCFRRVCTKLIN